MKKYTATFTSLEKTSFRRLVVVGFASFWLLFALIAMLTSFEIKYRFASSTIHNWLLNFSSESLMYVISLENRSFRTILPSESQPPTISTVVFELATSIKPGDIRSLLGRELPGFALYDAEIYVAGEGTDYTSLPIESAPPMEVLLQERKASLAELETPQSDEEVKPPPITTGEQKRIFIYHSHSSESFLPHLEGVDDPTLAHHSKVNITLVGKRFAEELEKRGIGAIADDTNIVNELEKKGLTFGSSYEVSREIVKSAMATNDTITYLFDLHRDSQRKDKTTVTIDGDTYSRFFFVVGKANAQYEQNLQFVKELNTRINEKYPGLSRGIITKDHSQGNGIYNQDLSDRSILLEVGGVDNTMDENYRAVTALAEVFSEYFWDVEEVSGQN